MVPKKFIYLVFYSILKWYEPVLFTGYLPVIKSNLSELQIKFIKCKTSTHTAQPY